MFHGLVRAVDAERLVGNEEIPGHGPVRQRCGGQVQAVGVKVRNFGESDEGEPEKAGGGLLELVVEIAGRHQQHPRRPPEKRDGEGGKRFAEALFEREDHPVPQSGGGEITTLEWV
jgi:hypothetical protein